jgi:crotonobetainyl-CoA:carnitine CoA-transferase CaiB-like acyl-CoA transferase
MTSLLKGLRIVEIGPSLAVRYAGRLLQGLGATVEQQGGRRDGWLAYGGRADAAYAAWLDAGKVQSARGQGPVDAVLLDDDTLDQLPFWRGRGVPVAAITWFPETLRAKGWRGSDGAIWALNGSAFSFGLPDGPPTVAQNNGPSVIAAVTALIPLLAGLIGRGQGAAASVAEVNALEASMCLTEGAAIARAAAEIRSGRHGVNRFQPTYPATCYPTDDGWIGVTTLTPPQWTALCTLLDIPDAATDPRFSSREGRLEHPDEIDALLAPRFLGSSARDWAEAGQALRIPLVDLVPPGQLPEAPHWAARGSFVPVAGQADLRGPRLPYVVTTHDRHAAPAARPATTDRPLAGIRVLDFTMGWSGPLATRSMADLGAEVIKVESEAYPDWWRGYEPASRADPPVHELNLTFAAMNRNKAGISLDLRTAEGQAAALDLVRGADLVIENYTPGVMEKFGLGFDRLREVNPDLVTLSMGAFGATGPRHGFRAYGSTVEQASGLCFVNGEAGWTPCIEHVAFGDPIAGLYACVAALAALHARQSGGGASIDLSQVECLFEIAAPAILYEQVEGAPVPRLGSARPQMLVSGCLRCAGPDDWVYVEIAEAEEAERLRAVLSLGPGAFADRLAAWTAARPPDAVAEAIQRAGGLAVPVRPAHDAAGYPPFVASAHFRPVERRYIGRHLQAGPAWLLNGARAAILRPAPVLGEHTAEVLARLYDPAEAGPATPG